MVSGGKDVHNVIQAFHYCAVMGVEFTQTHQLKVQSAILVRGFVGILSSAAIQIEEPLDEFDKKSVMD